MREQGKSSLRLISLLRKLTRTEGKTILKTGEIDAINTKCGENICGQKEDIHFKVVKSKL